MEYVLACIRYNRTAKKFGVRSAALIKNILGLGSKRIMMDQETIRFMVVFGILFFATCFWCLIEDEAREERNRRRK